MFLTRLKLGVAAALAIGTVAAGTSVVARTFPIDSWRPAPALESSRVVEINSGPHTPPPAKAERVILAAVDTLPSPPGLGGRDDFDVRGPSHQELQVRLAHAKHLLQEKEKLSKKGSIPQFAVDEVRLEVDVLQARLDASKEDLGDELERLEGRLRVKRAEAEAAKIRSHWIQEIHAQRPAPSEVAQSKADIAVREAELMEVEIRIRQVKRRLGLK